MLAVAVGLAVLVAGSNARAEDDEDNAPTIWNLDQRLWNGFMSALGVQNNTEVGIDYRERSPLVVPPTRNLPPPETGKKKNAAWPVDPEIKRKQEAASRKQSTPRDGSSRRADNGSTILPSELDPAGARRSAATSASRSTTAPNDEKLPPSELGYFGGLFSLKSFGVGVPKDEVGTFVAEPPRVALTAPPVGYQTPSPDQPYGATKRIEWGAPENVMDLAKK